MLDKPERTDKLSDGDGLATGRWHLIERDKAVHTRSIAHFAASHPHTPSWIKDMKASALQATSRIVLAEASVHLATSLEGVDWASHPRATCRKVFVEASGPRPTQFFLQKTGTVHK